MCEPTVSQRPGVRERVVTPRGGMRRKPPLDPGCEFCVVDDLPANRGDRAAVGERRARQVKPGECDLHQEFVAWVIGYDERLGDLAQERSQPAGVLDIRDRRRSAIQ